MGNVLTQSRSIEMVLMTELIFSTHASKDRAVREVIAAHLGIACVETMSQSSKQETAVASLCPTVPSQFMFCRYVEVVFLTNIDSLMDMRTTRIRSPRSMKLPTAPEKMITDAALDKAYTEAGNSVPGKMVDRKRTEPNSKTRLFHVDRKCEM